MSIPPLRSIERGKPPASKGVKLLGAGTDERNFFATEVHDRFICDVTIRFLRALQDEFEERWRQLKRLLGNRFVSSIDDRGPAVTAALDKINPPLIVDYLCRSV